MASCRASCLVFARLLDCVDLISTLARAVGLGDIRRLIGDQYDSLSGLAIAAQRLLETLDHGQLVFGQASYTGVAIHLFQAAHPFI